MIKKYVYKKRHKRKEKHGLKIIDEYNENKKEYIKVRNIIIKNVILVKCNVLPCFSEGYMKDL